MKIISKKTTNKNNKFRVWHREMSIVLSILSISAFGQPLTIEICQKNAKSNYPLIKQYELIEQTAQYNLSNANKGYLPQLSLSARATYQSQVTELPSALSQRLGTALPSLSNDQYQAVLEAGQTIWDGGIISAQKKITRVSTEVEKHKLEVDLFAINERVNQLYFGVLLLLEQTKQIEILQDELQTNFNRIWSLKQNGVANQSDVDLIRVEQLNANQRKAELKSTTKSYQLMLSTLTGIAISDATPLLKPEINLSIIDETGNQRPELKLFEAQNKFLENQKALLNAGNLPKIGSFVQIGYGKPGLNMLTNEFSGYYIGGIRMAWNFSGLYSQANNIKKIEINKKVVNIQKETFVFNTDLKTKQQKNEIEKLQMALTNDDEIIALRENIKKASTSKLENGIISVSDLIRDINAENQAKQAKTLHEIQLIMSIYQLKNSINY